MLPKYISLPASRHAGHGVSHLEGRPLWNFVGCANDGVVGEVLEQAIRCEEGRVEDDVAQALTFEGVDG